MENALRLAVAKAHIEANVAAVGALLTQAASDHISKNERQNRGRNSRQILFGSQH